MTTRTMLYGAAPFAGILLASLTSWAAQQLGVQMATDDNSPAGSQVGACSNGAVTSVWAGAEGYPNAYSWTGNCVSWAKTTGSTVWQSCPTNMLLGSHQPQLWIVGQTSAAGGSQSGCWNSSSSGSCLGQVTVNMYSATMAPNAASWGPCTNKNVTATSFGRVQ